MKDVQRGRVTALTQLVDGAETVVKGASLSENLPMIPASLPPTQGANKGNCPLFLLPLVAVYVPIKPCQNFSSGLLSILTLGLKSPRTQVCNRQGWAALRKQESKIKN